MNVLRSIDDIRSQVRQWRQAGLRVGVVPTMGALHKGHLSLVEAALLGCDRVVATIFVNPLQFGPADDFRIYPRDEATDARKLDEKGCHALFAPSEAEMFPDGITALKDFKTVVHVSQLTEGLCGAFRPGHFDGVTTIVAKLFGIVQPDAAYFGEKDYQQLLVIRRMCRDLNIPVEVVPVPTVRESDGLAMSSRNQYLSPEERHIAPLLYQTLRGVAERLTAGDDKLDSTLSNARRALLDAGFTKVDYITAADVETLEPLESLKRLKSGARVFAAAWLGQTRLIDNVPAT